MRGAFEHLVDEARGDGVHRHVVAAAVIVGGEVLLVRRSEADTFPGLYELPGGVIEAGESVEDALARELREETGFGLTAIRRFVGAFDYESGSGRTRQLTFAVDAAGPARNEVGDEFARGAFVDAASLVGLYVSDETRAVVLAAIRHGDGE